MNQITHREDNLFEKVSQLIVQSHQHVRNAVNTAMVYTYYGVGKYIVEDEQQGTERASYGKSVLKGLSQRLTDRYGKGWSVETLTTARKFYQIYGTEENRKHCLRFSNMPEDSATALRICGDSKNRIHEFTLSWSHYLVLMRIENPDERSFYEIECHNQNWSVRQLQRQYNSSLYERLALSRNKGEVMRLATEGQTIEKPADLLKSPLTLEFLGLKPETVYSESGLLKIDNLTHQDLGQMQMYVNYFDRFVKQNFKKTTIGILLCKEKNDTLVELTLPQDANIYASAILARIQAEKANAVADLEKLL